MAKRGRGRPRKVHSPDLAQNMPNSSNKKLTHPEFFKIYIPELASQVMLADNENASKGSSPASKSVVENLLSLVLTKEDVEENSSSVACAVCKDEFAVGEKVTKMPCSHLYHGECILPWLGIRNTCPVCRHELPTDDADYEKRKNGRIRSGSGGTVFDDFEIRL